jgi:copper(I)-binding protein
MANSRLTPAAITLMALALAAPAFAADVKAGALTLSSAWSRPAAQGQTGAGYVTVSNSGAADRLVSATTPAAGRVEIHQSMVMNGVASMHAMDMGVAVPAGGRAVLAPGGYHLMLVGLKAPLKAGAEVPVTLTFEKAGAVKTSFTVRTTAP